jgi:uncharacterized membrane protein
LSPKGGLIFFIAIFIFSALLALRFWLLGAWLVVPFFLLEMILLGFVLFLLAREAGYKETIAITAEYVSITVVEDGVKELYKDSFNLYWVEFVLKQDDKNWHPSRLYLKSHGHFIRIGQCLTDDDRLGLLKRLKQALNDRQCT